MSRIPISATAAVESLLTNFADTEFKTIALQLAASSAQQKGDFERMVVHWRGRSSPIRTTTPPC